MVKISIQLIWGTRFGNPFNIYIFPPIYLLI